MEELLKKNELLIKMAEIVHPLAQSDPLGDTPSFAYRLVRSVLRKNIMRVQAIVVVNGYDKLSDSGLEIVRNMIEDSISVSYILSDPDPEGLAEKVFEFRHVQDKQDLDYYSKLPDYIGEDLEKKRASIELEFDRVMRKYPEFSNIDGSPRHSWSKNGVEGMAEIIRKRKLYSKRGIRNLLRAYQLGSRKVHFNPGDLLNYYNQSSWDRSSLFALDISIKGTAASLTSIVIRYFDTITHFDPTYDGTKTTDALYDLINKVHQ